MKKSGKSIAAQALTQRLGAKSLGVLTTKRSDPLPSSEKENDGNETARAQLLSPKSARVIKRSSMQHSAALQRLADR